MIMIIDQHAPMAQCLGKVDFGFELRIWQDNTQNADA